MTTDAYERAMQSIPTPALLMDEVQVLQNIHAFQAHCNKAGLNLRPHIKTHKSIRFTHEQLKAGAVGITCQKLGEAEVMADAGVTDILITFNIIGSDKLERLKTLAQRVPQLAVTIDNAVVLQGIADAFSGDEASAAGVATGSAQGSAQGLADGLGERLAEGLAEAMAAGKLARAAKQPSLEVMVECDTGAGRCGVQSPEAAVELAREIVAAEGLAFRGLMTYPRVGGAEAAADFMKTSLALLDDAGIPCPVVSTGGTPDMWQAASAEVFTEYRIGTYVFNDRSLVSRGTCSESDCAARVIATVVSRPTPTRVIIDAGSKTLTSDLLGLTGYGMVVGYPEAEISALSEEHGTLSVPADCDLTIGQRVQVIPNHVCVVTNMMNDAWLVTSSGELEVLPIDARGLIT